MVQYVAHRALVCCNVLVQEGRQVKGQQQFNPRCKCSGRGWDGPACEQLLCDCQPITDPAQCLIPEAFPVGPVPLDRYVGAGLAEPALTGARGLPAKNRF